MSKKCESKKTAKKKAQYTCKLCGLLVTVDNLCECAGACDIICCGQEMKPEE